MLTGFAPPILGRIVPSPIGFGGASLGGLGAAMDRDTAEATVAAALDAGIRYFDTAPFYGFGLSERRLGDLLRGVPDVTVSTKVGRILVADRDADTGTARHGYVSPLPFAPHFDYSYDGVMRSYEASLHRLGLARIDILYVHDIGRLTHGATNERHWGDLFGGGYRALQELKSAGDIAAIGLGINECEAGVAALAEAPFDLIMLAGRYTLLDHGAMDRLFPACKANGTRIVAAAIYNSGILVSGSRNTPIFDYAPASSEIILRTCRIERICDDFCVPLAAAALQFVLAHPLVDAAVPGLASARHVLETMAWRAMVIPRPFWDALAAEGLIGGDHGLSGMIEDANLVMGKAP